MNNNSTNVGELKTFRQLIEEETSIIIPKVQRDYAYGREEKKVADILDGMLTSMLKAVVEDKSNILDFVYGGSYVQRNNVSAGFIPLDGQQRLTTLFLLFFYASLLGDENQNPIDKSNVEMLKRFRYETRQSATEFCSNLIGGIRDNLISNEYNPSDRNIKELIKDDALFLSTYESDPTIVSMLNVLGKIEGKCIDMQVLNLTPCFWNRLYERENNQFYRLALDKFGLTDDLFIKMNARGKKLTEFEIFKSDIVAAIKEVNEGLKDDFSENMDNKWVDVVWDYTDKKITGKRKALDVTNDADNKYAMLFHNIFRLEFYRRDLQTADKPEPAIKDILCDKDGIQHIIDLFDFIHDVHKKAGFRCYWDKYFYFSDDVIGKDDEIRLFWQQKRKSVFELALEGELSVPETVYLYSLYYLHKNSCDDETCKRCLRIIHNLMTANVRAVDARTNKLPGFLQEVEYIIDKKGVDVYYDREDKLVIGGKPHKLSFIQNAWNEEYVKQNCLEPDDYKALMRFENHDILRCSLSLFMDYCGIVWPNEGVVNAPSNASKLLELLRKFESLFGNSYREHFFEIKTMLLDDTIEYMQYEPYMVKDATKKYRYFITRPVDLSSFYIKHNTRQDQSNILEILDKKIPNPINYSSKQFSDVRDWKYYVAKYPEKSNISWTSYGIGVWDDPVNYPLDLVLLNSSYHSDGNLEWMMMTYLLWNVLGDNNKYQRQDHGCEPILINANASSIGFKKGKWHVQTTKDLDALVKSHFKLGEVQILKTDTDNYDVDLDGANLTMDYIDLGKELVKLVE